MGRSRLREWLETFGLMAVFVSLVFVGLELRQSREIAMDASLSASAEIITAIEALVLEHPDVWLRGCRGDGLEEADDLVFTHIFHAYVFQHFMLYMRSGASVASASGDLAIDNVAINVHRNPGFAAAWHDLARWRSYAAAIEGNDLRRWRGLVDARVAYWREAEPEPLVMHERCGLI